MHGSFDSRCRAPLGNDAIGDKSRIFRGAKHQIPVPPANPILVKAESCRQSLRLHPRYRTWRRIEGMYPHAESPNQLEVKGNVLAHSERIDYAPVRQAIWADVPFRPFVPEAGTFAAHLSPKIEVSPADRPRNVPHTADTVLQPPQSRASPRVTGALEAGRSMAISAGKFRCLFSFLQR